jgi:hypothetical protein
MRSLRALALALMSIGTSSPREADRILDISPAAAHKLGIGHEAMRQVKLEVVSKD